MVYSITPLTSIAYSDRQVHTTKAPNAPSAPLEENKAPSVAENTRMEYRSTSSYTSLNQGKSSGVEAYKAVDDAKEPENPYAATVLRFINLQLQRDVAAGATEGELQSRLQAGLDGFIEGYHQAFDQLSAMGVLDENVKSAIEDTYNRVLDGIAAMADKNGLTNPVQDSDRRPTSDSADASAAPTDASPAAQPLGPESVPDRVTAKNQHDLELIQQLEKLKPAVEIESAERSSQPPTTERARSGSYSVSEAREFDFKVRTAEGDEVTVRINADATGRSQVGGASDAQWLQGGQQSSHMSFSVAGDLNEQERKAINTLLEKVNGVSEAFFSGKFERAFEMASNFRLEGDQIQSFSLNLQMTKTEQASLGQGLYTPQIVGRGAERNHIESFADMLQQAARAAEQLDQPRTLVADLLAYIAEQTHPDHPRTDLLVGIAKQML